jgi:hypothetical protein
MLASLIPEAVEQVRTGAVPAKLARLVGVGDIGIRSFFAIRSAITAIAQSRPLDAVLITGSPFYPMLLAGFIREQLDLPVILDFQDPWVSAEGATRNLWTKGRLAYQLATMLEPQAVCQAAFITSVSEVQNAEMVSRYPWLDDKWMAAIPIGGDPDDYETLRAMSLTDQSICLSPQKINLCYVGTFLPRASEVVRVLFRAARCLRERNPELARRLNFVFVGTSNQPKTAGGEENYRVTPIAIEEGVGDLLIEFPERVPFLEALSINANAHALLLLGSDEPHYTASKIYPALMSGRPWISIFHERSSSHRILRAAGGGLAFAFTKMTSVADITQLLADGLERIASSPLAIGRTKPEAYAPYTASAVAEQFARVLNRVAR